MLSKSLAMLFTRMGKILSFLTPWKNLPLMFLEEAFTMAVSYRGCEKKLHLFQSTDSYHPFSKTVSEKDFFLLNPFLPLLALIVPNFVQCKIRTRNCHISTRRKRNHHWGALQNQKW